MTAIGEYLKDYGDRVPAALERQVADVIDALSSSNGKNAA